MIGRDRGRGRERDRGRGHGRKSLITNVDPIDNTLVNENPPTHHEDLYVNVEDVEDFEETGQGKEVLIENIIVPHFGSIVRETYHAIYEELGLSWDAPF